MRNGSLAAYPPPVVGYQPPSFILLMRRRKALGLTRAQFAELADISYQGALSVEHGNGGSAVLAKYRAALTKAEAAQPASGDY